MLMLMMFSMGASADVKIFFGEKGEELKTGETKIQGDNGTIAIEQKASDDGSSTTIYLTFTPNNGYTISSDNIEVYAVISTGSGSTRTPEISGDPLKLTEESSKAPEKRYSVKIDSKLGLWIKKAEFVSGSKGNRDAVTYTYYALHNKDKGYLKQYKGIVGNDGIFRYENAHHDNGSSIWVYSSDGYLQQEMYYLNVLNDKTLVLSTTPVTQWDLIDDGDKKRFQLHGSGSTKILGFDGSKVVLAENPTYKYAACTLTVTENNSKWEGPKDVSWEVQSPQLVTYLRTYYLRNITVKIDKNDADTENVKVVDAKDARAYCSLTYDDTQTAPSGKGTTWDINTTTGIIYNISSDNKQQTAVANYTLTPLDPIVLVSHPAAISTVTLKVNAKAFTPGASKKYLLFNTQDNNYRFPKASLTLSDGELLPVNGKQSDLTETVNGDITWIIETDAEGFCLFKNVTTNTYLYYDAADYTVSDYGAVKMGSDTPSSDTRYKFRLYSGCGNRDPFGGCYYIIPYEKQFAVWKKDGVLGELYFTLYMNTSNSTKIASIYKTSDNAKWKIYSYEWQNRLWSDYTINGDKDIYTSGDHVYTATTWISRNIKDSPSNTDYCTLPNSKTKTGITYTWQLTGLDGYVTTPDDVEAYGISTLTANVTLPPGTRSGTLKVTATISSPFSANNNTSIPITLYNLSPTFTDINSLAEIEDANGLYKLKADVPYTAPAVTSFSGTLDGDGHIISGLTAPLFTTLSNGTVRNLMLDNVSINSGTNVGAICGEANGMSRIYNCGILATESTVTTDENGYTHIATNSSKVGGSNYVGGLVGLLDGEARVINCFSYADITGGTNVGGIVGYNNVATTSQNLKTMVMNCMFYGDITGGTNKAPIYNGQIITNVSTGTGTNNKGVSNFNYFWGGASYVQNQQINTYNCALMAETRFLQRFEFFRPLLNSNRALAAWWATGSRDNKDKMAKWVLEPSQIGTATPYPILKPAYDSNSAIIKYPSVVNIDAAHAEAFSDDAAIKKTQYNQGRKFDVTFTINIQMGSDSDGDIAPTGASITQSQVTPNITDKDPTHFNFNYYKVQLPYYNDVGTGNYTKASDGTSRVVTGWKIVSISNGTHNFSTTGSDAMATVSTNENTKDDITLTTPYNFADRNCTDKDKYSKSGRVFNQGAYFDVPEGVTSITIEPYWAKCVYVSDAYPDVVYNQGMGTAYNVPIVGGGERYKNNTEYSINGISQKVYTSMSNAVSALNPSGTVYDNAIVLVGNVHSLDLFNKENNKPFTIMSIDLDKDNEPDYSYILRFNSRVRVHPVRIDFLNVIGLGMAQKSTGGTGTYNFGIMQPYGWFEVTNTGLFRVTQLEYDMSDRTNSPIILHGGVIEQWVTYAQKGSEAKTVTYYHVGGNVWFKEFHIGQHQDRTEANANSPHPPISVTGGDYEEFYLTGLYNTPTNNYDDNAECYINGGRFGKVAGTGYQGIGASGGNSKGDIIWQIDNADIDEFYAGGINAAHKAEGNIYTVITNSRVDQFCGGPKFGDMNSDKKVVTNATDCTFRTFFGAGYGGNSYNRRYPANQTDKVNIDWDSWVQGNDGLKYRYDSGKGGVETRIDYQFLPMSGNTLNVCRLFVDYVSFSLATTHDVTSKLTGCTITKSPLGSLDLFEGCLGNFYGGGSLGKVEGPVKSTLIDCTVEGNAFGAGYSATLPTVGVMNNYFQTQPHYDENLGAYLEAKLPATTPYKWAQRDVVNSTETAINTTDSILYTTEDLTALGKVTGTATLNIEGTTTVAGNVYGGGEESNVEGNTEVTMSDGTIGNGSSIDVEHGNVFGGGKGSDEDFECVKAMVGVNNAGAGVYPGTDENKDKGTKVTISNGTVYGNVYGGGEVGRVEWNTQVTIGTAGDTQKTPTVNGSVFGAGAGKETHGYSALVRGNSTVTVQGKAKVLQNVYGGGEKATVGRYWVKGINDNVDGAPTAPSDLPTGMPYQQQSGGKCKVIIQDNAQIGPDDGGTKTAGHVFGAGKGVLPQFVESGEGQSQKMVKGDGVLPDRLVAFTADETHATAEDAYLEFLQTLALVTNSNVTIDGSATVKGSVYGGSESGYVQHNTNVIVKGGTIGTTDLGGAYYGNVYGGGKGDADYTGSQKNYFVAGIVKGSTKVTIQNTMDGESILYSPNILHNVYGGGAYGTVGVFDYGNDGLPTALNANAPENSGKTEIHITGGTIGTTGKENGMIFGSSRGDVGDENSIHNKLAWVYDTHVAIGDTTENATISIATPLIRGSIYGGGENGHNFRNSYVRINGGTIGIPTGDNVTVTNSDNSTTTYEAYNYPYRGNVYGGGCGTDKYYASGVAGQGHTLNDGLGDTFNPKAGIVQGNAFVNMTAGYVVHNVYGAGAMGSVGTATSGGKTTVTISGGRVGYDGTRNGNVFGAARGEYGTSTAESGLANVRETEVNISYATTPAGDDANKTTQLIAGSVFGGGESGTVKENVAVNMTGGLILEDLYGGGALAHTQTSNWNTTNNTWAEGKTSASNTTTVNLLGGTIHGEAYGGGLGQKTGFYDANGAIATSDIEATVYGDITVNLGSIVTPATETEPAVPGPATAFDIRYEDTGDKDEANNPIKVVQSGRVFGCNNLNGSPQGDVTVNVFKTVEGNVARTTTGYKIKEGDEGYVAPTYELAAVYGGGNLADYTATGKKASVIIHTCDVSVQHVYGGGNAAAVPETDVLVQGAYEIEHVFGGGNGKDKYKKGNEWIINAGANVSTNTNTLLIGGYIHEAYGGSNEKGTIGGNVTINIDSKDERCVCDLELVKLYGAGKNADIDGDLIVVLDCAPETKTEEIYGGAENANVRGNVELTITSGSFGKVFGGNNQSGAIFGHIILNIEETGCRPIIIDELYGCGNNAAYSVYGYKESTDADGYKIYVPRTSENDGTAVTFNKDANQTAHTTPKYADPQLNIISCTSIGKVFGGGYGSGAVVYGNPTVNINQIYGKAYDGNAYTATATTLGEIGEVFGGGNEANVVGNTNVNIGTASTVQLHELIKSDGTYQMSGAKPVVGANITGNVYGGGNKAEVTGNTNVNIGRSVTP